MYSVHKVLEFDLPPPPFLLLTFSKYMLAADL